MKAVNNSIIHNNIFSVEHLWNFMYVRNVENLDSLSVTFEDV